MAMAAAEADHRPIRVLFLCTGNSARSQLAEALLTHLGHGRFDASSAGTEPAGVNPLTVRVLADRGIDWSDARSKPVGDLVDRPFDYVITVCDRARQACPVFPGARRVLDWDLEDPAAVQGTGTQRAAAFERTARIIEERLRDFMASAMPSEGPAHHPS